MTSMSAATVPIYHTYAPIYDAIGQDRFGASMARRTLSWLGDRGIPVEHVLDLACGSGAAALVFAAAGHAVVGLDQSAAMLDIARGKALRAGHAITFVQGDMRDPLSTNDQRPTTNEHLSDVRRLPRAASRGSSFVVRRSSFDLATCFYDSLNYLTGDGDLELVFESVARLLRPGGHLVFDMNTQAEYSTWDERDVVTYDGRDYLVYNRLDYDADTRLATGRIVWFVREIERWWRGEETHIQRAWDDGEVSAALARAGLELAARLGPDGAEAGSDAPRVMYVAQRSR